MNWASARCRRATGPRRNGKRAPRAGAGVEVQAERRAHVDVVLTESRSCAAPAAQFDVAALVGTARHRVVRQVGHRHQHLGERGLDRVQALGAGFSSPAATSAIAAAPVLALGLGSADRARQRCAVPSSSVRDWLVLRSASKGGEALHVQKGLGIGAPRARRRREVVLRSRLMSSMGAFQGGRRMALPIGAGGAADW